MTKVDALKHFFLPMPLNAKVIKSILKYLFWFMAIVFAAQFLAQANAVMRSGSSSAAVGFIFLPVEATLSSIKVWVFAFALGYFITVLLQDSPKLNLFFIIFALILLKGIYVFSSAALDVIKTKLSIYEINAMHGENFLDNQFEQYTIYPKEFQPFILEAIALNPFASKETLDKIAKIEDPALENKLESLYFFQPANVKGFSVKRLVARNGNTSADTLRMMAESSSAFVLEDIAANPNTPVEVLEKLSNKEEEQILKNLIDNVKTPKNVLEKLANSEESTIRDYAKAKLSQRK